MSFVESLEQDKVGESHLARWLIRRGCCVQPVYEIADGQNKGPGLYGDFGRLVAPDALVFGVREIFYAECKWKTAFTYYRRKQTFETGIDWHHWKQYLQVAEQTGVPVWLFFLHACEQQAKDTPEGLAGPCGLFAQDCSELQDNVSHIDPVSRPPKQPHGMIYWAPAALRKLAEYQEVVSEW